MTAQTMAAPRTLRPYQVEAVDAVSAAWDAGMTRPSVVLPTGTGKSTVIARLAVDARSRGERVVMLAHRGELLRQMADSVTAVDPGGEDVGIVQADSDEHETAIVAASFQTLTSPRRTMRLLPRTTVLVDEAHHAPAASYRGVLEALGAFDTLYPARVCGFTATMTRADGAALGEIWDEVVFERSLDWAIAEGYLVPPRGKTIVVPELDKLAGIRNVAGDYAQGRLAEVMAASVDSTVQAVQQHAAGRAMIVFAAGVDHAYMLADMLTDAGVPARAVVGSHDRLYREAAYADFADGVLSALVTVQVLTEGADFPRCDAVVMARPTRSQSLYSQMVGRSLRLYPDKTDALVLDLTGVSRDMRLVTLTDLYGDAEVKRHAPDSDDELPEVDEPIAAAPARAEREGVLDMVDIELLGGASSGELVWLRTPGGVPFLDCRDELVFIWAATEGARRDSTDGPMQVGHITSKGERSGGWLGHGATGTWDQAVAAAERYAVSTGSAPKRRASWRTRNQPPSEGQLRYAASLGIVSAETMTRGRLADEISTRVGARRLDTK